MTDRPDPATIGTLAELLAHALELEHEAAGCYRQLADSLEVHHNHPVARLFRQLADRTDAIAARTGERISGVVLPRIAPWDYKWQGSRSPKAGGCEDRRIGYRMTVVEALELALQNETRGQAFYARIAAQSGDRAMRRVAAELVADQAKRLDWLRRQRDALGSGHPAVVEDLDPPNVPA